MLARAGYRVVGVDRSPVLLDEARQRAGEGEWPQWVQADHRELPFEDASFDAALNLFSALGYRGEDGDRQTIAELKRVLRPGGALVVETMHRDRLMHIYQRRGWDPLSGGDLLLEEREFDYVAGEIETTHSLVEAGGKRESLTYRFRVYTATELARLVEEAGFVAVVLRRLGASRSAGDTADPRSKGVGSAFVRPEDLYDVVWASDPRLSPDGKTVAYAVNSIDRDENTYRSAIWLAASTAPLRRGS